MTAFDWTWKIREAVERIRTRYHFMGRKTGAPFLALVYPPDSEASVYAEWRTQMDALRPEFDLRLVDVLSVTQRVLSELGAENVVGAIANPMPGSNPEGELGRLWVTSVADAVRGSLAMPGPGKRVVSIERLAAFYPAAGPRDLMEYLWDSAQSFLEGPVVVLIPGSIEGPRLYTFVDRRSEFMYRGDLL